jgi:hypothetical protein
VVGARGHRKCAAFTGVAITILLAQSAAADVASERAATHRVRRALPGNLVEPPDSASLIDAALAGGQIDADTALKYKVFAMFDDPRLPAAMQGDDSRVIENPVLEELNARFDELSLDDQAALGPFLLRPSSAGSWLDPAVQAGVVSARATRPVLSGRPICSGLDPHWASIVPTVAQVRVWYDTRKPGHNTVAQAVAIDLESNAWPVLITQLGFKPPLDDTSLLGCDGGDARLDFYIVDVMNGRGLTTPEGIAFFEAPTYIMIKSTLSPVVRQQAVTHELMHAIQWSYHMASSQSSYGWLRDAMANWAVDPVHPTNAALLEMATCYTESPELALDSRAKGYCKQGADINRDYGSYLFFQFLSRTYGPATVKAVLQATTTESTSLGAVNSAIPGGFATQWPKFAKTLWNQAPIDAKPASFKMWDGQPATPVLAEELGKEAVSGDLGGKAEDTIDLSGTVVNLSSRYYRFTFSDPATRSLMFHNGFYQNWKRGEKVNVQAMWRPAGGSWTEEDWTQYEWIGLCRDLKLQRIAELVVVVSASEWNAPGYPVSAVATPSFARNNVGCWGFEGTTKLVYTHPSWSGGTITTNVSPVFRAQGPIQFTDLFQARLRVPIIAPQLFGAAIDYHEAYSENGCSYAATYQGSSQSTVVGGSSVGNLVIRYFRDAELPSLQPSMDDLLGVAPRAYVGQGATTTVVHGTATGDETCAGAYSTNVGAWFLTNDDETSPPQVLSTGHLKGTFHPLGTNDSSTYTWDLTPVLEP